MLCFHTWNHPKIIKIEMKLSNVWMKVSVYGWKYEKSSICDFITLTILFLEKANERHQYEKPERPWGSMEARQFKTWTIILNIMSTGKDTLCCPPATCLRVSPSGSPRHSQSVALHLVSGSVVCVICPRPRWPWRWSSGSGFQSIPIFHRFSR